MRFLWLHLKRILRVIGNFQARVLLTIFYILIVAPLGIVVRFFLDPLRARQSRDAQTYWLVRNASTQGAMEEAREQG